MFSLKKNNVIAGVLVVMVATAGYLNFTQKDVDTQSDEVSYNYDEILDADSVTVLADDTDGTFTAVNDTDARPILKLPMLKLPMLPKLHLTL